MTVAFTPLPFEPQQIEFLRPRFNQAIAPLWDLRNHKPGQLLDPMPECLRLHVLDLNIGNIFFAAGLRFVVTREVGRSRFQPYHLIHVSCCMQGPPEELSGYKIPLPIFMACAQHYTELIAGRRMCRPVNVNVASSGTPHLFYDPADLGIPDPPELRAEAK